MINQYHTVVMFWQHYCTYMHCNTISVCETKYLIGVLCAPTHRRSWSWSPTQTSGRPSVRSSSLVQGRSMPPARRLSVSLCLCLSRRPSRRYRLVAVAMVSLCLCLEFTVAVNKRFMFCICTTIILRSIPFLCNLSILRLLSQQLLPS